MKPTKKPSSLQRLLLLRLIAPLAILLLCAALFAYRYAVHYANLALDTSLYDSARALAQQVKLSKGAMRLDLPKVAVEIFEWDGMDRLFYSVTADREGQVFGNAKFPPLSTDLPPDMQPLIFNTELNDLPVRAVAVVMNANDERVYVQVAETLSRRYALAEEMLLAMIIPQCLLLLAATIAIGYGVAGGLRPLAQLAAQIKVRRFGDLSPLHTDVPIEVAPLTEALNRLFAELSEAQNAQQRFIADAAHQLRTPLATLQVQAERALREPDPIAGAEAVKRVLIAVRRLNHLVHQLLTLARAEPSAARQALQPCDLAALAREATMDWVPAALERNVDLGYNGPDSGVTIPGDPLLLRELINNLIDNALKYGLGTKRVGLVTVSVEPGVVPLLSVEDHGPGIPPEARELVLERFTRLPGSVATGSGLGLSIVREIAARHGATVTIGTPDSGAGARIVIIFAPDDKVAGAPLPLEPAAG